MREEILKLPGTDSVRGLMGFDFGKLEFPSMVQPMLRLICIVGIFKLRVGGCGLREAAGGCGLIKIGDERGYCDG